MRTALLAFTAALAIAASANAQPDERHEAARPAPSARPAAPERAAPPAPRAAPAYGGQRFQPPGSPAYGGQRFQPPGGPSYSARVQPDRYGPQGGVARPYNQGGPYGLAQPYQSGPGGRVEGRYGQAYPGRPGGYAGAQPGQGYPARQGFYGTPQSGQPYQERQGYNAGRQPAQIGATYDHARPGYGQRQGFVGGVGGVGAAQRPRFDARREYGGEQRDWQRAGGFHGDFDRYRHDYVYRDWHRDEDRDRLVIINRYGYSPWGYGFRPGWDSWGRGYWGSNVGWGFDLRFGYWYGPSYYDPGFDWWYGARAPYEYGVRAEELILRDSTLHNWALNYFDYNRDGYLDRDEVRAAARSLRQIVDYNGDGWIQASEYRAAIDRLGGAAYAYQQPQPAYGQGGAYDGGQGYEPGYDGPPPPDGGPY